MGVIDTGNGKKYSLIDHSRRDQAELGTPPHTDIASAHDASLFCVGTFEGVQAESNPCNIIIIIK